MNSIIEESDKEEYIGVSIKPIKKRLEDMEKNELLEILKKDKENKKKYIKKYQQTEKGKNKTREASKKYYDANRALILEKKRQYYLRKKQEKAILANN
jgi:TusA-related sulfurtransferase